MVGAIALAPRPLHPAARRKLPASLPELEPHEVLLRPLFGGDGAAMIVTATEPDFVGAVLDDLAAEDAPTRIAARRGRRRGSDGVLELHLPMHRRFHLVLLEACCRRPGYPRLDPAKLAGMGLVLRQSGQAGWSGWMKDSSRRKGWLALQGDTLDPDPALRPQPTSPAARQIATLIAARRGSAAFAEETVPLFVAPPDLCAKLGRTVLYGMVPVASAEESDVAPPAPDYAGMSAAEAGEMRRHLSEYLKERAALPMPRAGQTLDPGWRPLSINPATAGTEDGRLYAFGVFLQQLMVEFGAFEGGPAGNALLGALDAITLVLAVDGDGKPTSTITAGAFCARAARVLVGGEANPPDPAADNTTLTMPLAWPAIDATAGGNLSDLALACLPERFAVLAAPTPKFDRPSAQYAVRGFIRAQLHEGCPPRLVWSDSYSENFRILPWWEGDGPLAKVALPGIGDLKKLKPNVAFQVPPDIANLLAGDPKDTMDGKAGPPGFDIMWLCSFSIPAITICAFIVLGIIISILNLFLGWMAWIKICIPIPKPK